MGSLIDKIMAMDDEKQVDEEWEGILKEPKLVEENMEELWHRIISCQVQFVGINNAIEAFKRGEQDPDKLRSYLTSTGIDMDISNDDLSNPRFIDKLKKKISEIFKDFSNLIAKCQPLIRKTPLGWKCNQIQVSANFPLGVGVSFSYGPP